MRHSSSTGAGSPLDLPGSDSAWTIVYIPSGPTAVCASSSVSLCLAASHSFFQDLPTVVAGILSAVRL